MEEHWKWRSNDWKHEINSAPDENSEQTLKQKE